MTVEAELDLLSGIRRRPRKPRRVPQVAITTRCPQCGDSKTMIVDRQALEHYQRSAKVQDAFPDMDRNDRERLITGICPSCWDLVFPQCQR